MSDLSKRIANLTPEQRARLEERLLKKGPAATQVPPIPPSDREGPYPLSLAQERSWFICQVEPESPVFNEPLALRLRGAMNAEAMKRALAEILRRHGSLRTVFGTVDGRPVQTVNRDAELEFAVRDITHVPLSDRENEARRIVTEEAWRLFDLGRGPLMRAMLVRLAGDDQVLLIAKHHIATDGWSSGVLFKELTALYNAFSAGQASPLPEMPIQYTDCVMWQQEHLKDDKVAGDIAYWESKLSGSPVLELPTDHARPSKLSFRGSRFAFEVPAETAKLIENLARAEHCTPFMVLMAAFKTLLHRYSGQDDIIVGSPIANRGRTELEGLIGLFMNTLVLRTDLSGDPTFRDLLRQVRRTAMEAYAHQDAPFEMLVERLSPNRDTSRAALAQVVFVFLDWPLAALKLAGLECSPFEFERKTSKFDLALFMGRDAGNLKGTFEYSTDLFERDTIERMAGHFLRLLHAAAAAPDTAASRLPMMSDAEVRQVVYEWNDTRTDYPRDRCVHEIFQAQAKASGDAVAASFEGREITYRALESRANRLANFLLNNGVRHGQAVALAADPSIEMLVGMLGILKAGAAYAPIDPSYPRERVEFMLSDIAAGVILTQERHLSRLPAGGATVACLDSQWETIARESDAAPANSAAAESTACLIYTSGSTGAPKASRITHRGINRLVLNTNYIDLGPKDVVPQASVVTFDAATFEIWGAFLTGAKLVGCPRETLVSADDMSRFIRDNGITVMMLTSSLFNHFARISPGMFKPLRCLMFGGEVADAACARMVAENNPPEILYNIYGPTETTVYATYYRVTRIPPHMTNIPIGRPLSNTEVYVLDSHRQPVPIGVPGEICIGGDGVARGYLNRPELTAERFIADPFKSEPGVLLYRTGDLGRFLPDGNIEFLGRADDQVKIRGFRIEPGEIEIALADHPLVHMAAVTKGIDSAGEQRLVAYVTRKGEQTPSPGELRAFLESKLPDFMIPSAYIVLDRFPVTPSGKIDRKALPEPDWLSSPDLKGFTAPRTPVEDALAKIWAEALCLEKVGVRDNFFELGGHSLLAVRVFTRVETVFGKKLPLATLFAAPTIEKLAVALSDGGRLDHFPPIVAIERGGGGVPVFGMATADAFIFAGLAKHLGSVQPFYGLHPQGIVPVTRPVIDIRSLAARYVEEIRKVTPKGPYRLLGMCAGGVVAYEAAQQLVSEGQEVDFLGLIDTAGPFGVWLKLFLRLREVSRTADHAYRHAVNLWLQPRGKKLEYLTANLARVFRKILGRPTPAAAPRKETPVDRAYWMAYNGAYLSALARYRPRPYPGRIVLFVASSTEPDRFSKSRLEWRRLARGGADIYEVPGIHAEMLHDEQARIIADYLKRRFAESPRKLDSHVP